MNFNTGVEYWSRLDPDSTHFLGGCIGIAGLTFGHHC